MSNRKDLGARFAVFDEALRTATGRNYWRTLEELAGTEAFQEMMRQEFPAQADVWPDGVSRRRFLSLMGASLALAGLAGCSVKPAPMSKIVPYVSPPRDMVPGEPLFFATTMTAAGAAVGLLVESHMGRPTKVEGNPDHPASLGATGIHHQASILGLYDPDRSQVVTHLGRTRTWDEFVAAMRATLAVQRARRGAGVRILSEPIVSPSLARLRRQIEGALPEARWHVYEPVNRDHQLRGLRNAFGEDLSVRYDFRRADVVLSLDADFLSGAPATLRYARDFTSRRRGGEGAADAQPAQMNRLYVVETAVTNTGAKADHRLPLRAGRIEDFARAVASAIGLGPGAPVEPAWEKWIGALARDLTRRRGRAIVIAGERQPAAVHLLAHALNHHLGNAGQTVFYTPPVEDRPVLQTESLGELVRDMAGGKVEVLVVLGANPVYTAPADFDFAKAVQRVALRVHLGLYQDETARLCHWHIPEAHYLETWGDARAFDGTASLVQPLIQPLYQGRSALELAALLAASREIPGEEIVQTTWREHWDKARSAGEFSDFWKTSLHDGIIRGTAFAAKSVALRDDWQMLLGAPGMRQPPASENRPGSSPPLELTFEPDPTVYDGSFANNGWLQELPKPLTKLTWDNAVLMSPSTAEALGVGFGEYAHGGEHGGYHMPVVELHLDGRSVRAPVWIMPGHADGAVTVSLGYGRTAAGRVGGMHPGTEGFHNEVTQNSWGIVGGERDPVGFNAYALRTSEHPWFASGLRLATTGSNCVLACTQQHHLMENRSLVRSATLGEYRQDPGFASKPLEERQREVTRRAQEPLDFYQPFDYEPPLHKWGMVIDLTACIGCNACVVACQAENNIPVVGKAQVAYGREMHWIRVDRYTRGPAARPDEFHFQPVPCMHCEHAPCEYVCPVEATIHSAEGLNEMVYNRCVGTRFCSNNCPYKVRRFNFFHYADYETPSLRLQYNPDVTVRSRGVMEKCSYCVQRIRHAEIDAEREGRPIRDGEVLTACQAACPAQAIVFGDLNDPKSAVAAQKNSPLNYGLLAELNTAPRTTFLAALRNPNPELEGG